MMAKLNTNCLISDNDKIYRFTFFISSIYLFVILVLIIFFINTMIFVIISLLQAAKYHVATAASGLQWTFIQNRKPARCFFFYFSFHICIFVT